jgi:hypothetical protein
MQTENKNVTKEKIIQTLIQVIYIIYVHIYYIHNNTSFLLSEGCLSVRLLIFGVIFLELLRCNFFSVGAGEFAFGTALRRSVLYPMVQKFFKNFNFKYVFFRWDRKQVGNFLAEIVERREDGEKKERGKRMAATVWLWMWTAAVVFIMYPDRPIRIGLSG